MVTVDNLTKFYGDLKVLDAVSLAIEQGELVAITGPSGAGKSTLLHLMGALDTPDSGSVRINGTDVFALSPKKQALYRNRHLGFVFQFHHLLPEFTAIENIAMPLWISGKSKGEGLQRAKELLDLVGLSSRADHKPSALSGGEQQRVAIARALANNPDVIMADEPTGNLDSANAAAIHQLFSDLRRQLGQTFVLVTHNETLAALADRHIHMRDGRIVSV